MTAVDMRGRVDELADGTGGSVDAVTGAAIGPYWKIPAPTLLAAFPTQNG
jgi:hypothetical protein